MRSTGCVLALVPKAKWPDPKGKAGSSDELTRRLEDLARQERRIRKGVNVKLERRRYAASMRRIEELLLNGGRICPDANTAFGLARTGEVSLLELGSDYNDLLVRARRVGRLDPMGESRLGAAVIPPRAVSPHLEAFDALVREQGFEHVPAIMSRLFILRPLVKQGGGAQAGLIEIRRPLRHGALAERDREQPVPAPPISPTWWERLLGYLKEPTSIFRGEEPFEVPSVRVEAAGDPTAWQRARQDERGEALRRQLEGQIDEGLASGVPMTVNVRHELLTTTLRDYVGRALGQEPAPIGVRYSDGSEAEPILLRSVAPPVRGWAATRILHSSLMSMRHLELDAHVDLAWYRNLEVPSDRSLGEADRWCTERSRTQLAELRGLCRGGRLQLHLYHTGFEPAVMGFYRALVEELAGAGGEHWIRVVPMLADGKAGSGFKAVKAWVDGS